MKRSMPDELSTIRLLKIINSSSKDVDNVWSLYISALKNKIPLLFLCSSLRNHDIQDLRKEYDYCSRMLSKRLKTIFSISELFETHGIEYVVFKTLKPFHELTADVDILILGFSDDYECAKRLLGHAFKLLREGPLAVTFYDLKSHLMIDVHREIGVNRLIYIDKSILREYVIYLYLHQGRRIKMLKPEIELAVVASHSLFKAQTYLLSQYYTFRYTLPKLLKDEIKTLINFAKKERITWALKTHLTLTQLLSYFDISMPQQLCELLNAMGGINKYEASRFTKASFNTPYKYSTITLLKAILEKLGTETFKISLVNQLLHPPFQELRILLKHKELMRELNDHRKLRRHYFNI